MFDWIRSAPSVRFALNIGVPILVSILAIEILINRIPDFETGVWFVIGFFLACVLMLVFLCQCNHLAICREKQIKELEKKSSEEGSKNNFLEDIRASLESLSQASLGSDLHNVLDGFVERIEQVILRNQEKPSHLLYEPNQAVASEDFSGEWYGTHTSLGKDGKKAFSHHKYSLEVNDSQIGGTMEDNLSRKRYGINGAFSSQGVIWVLDDIHDPTNFGIEVYFSPISKDEMGGVLIAFDYINQNAFVSPILLKREGYHSNGEFIEKSEQFSRRVRIDCKPHLIAKKIVDDDRNS